MSLIDRLLGKRGDEDALRPLYDAVVARAREAHWYRVGKVPDTLDGRFELIVAILSLALVRIEDGGEEGRRPFALLVEIFIEDMEGQLRQMGTGDLVIGKEVGRMTGALGGRLGAYRAVFHGDAPIEPALIRNLYRGAHPEGGALDHVADRLQRLIAALKAQPSADLIGGRLP